MRQIDSGRISEAVARLYVKACTTLPDDVKQAVRAARQKENSPLAAGVLDYITENFELGDGVPLCQDTGMACVFLQVGQEVQISGDVAAAVDAGVADACAKGFLRSSVVWDPLRRGNTGNNTPAMLTVELAPGDAITVTVAPKGFGSENMSRVAMLKPADGVEGVENFVVETVRRAGGNPCPPVVVGVGLGGTFDKAALLAKKALLRPLGQPSPDAYYAQLEREWLEKINALGIGPQGLGGRATALAVAIETLPTHIAGLPCAVNLNCHVARHATEVI